MAYEEEEHMGIMWKRNSPDENWVAFTTKDYHKRMNELLQQVKSVGLAAVSGSVADAVGRNCPFCGEPCPECSHKATDC